MQNIFIDILPPWVETGLQPAFYDLESGTVLQQTARMYAKVRELTEAFNTFSENVTNEINTFEQDTNDEIERFENATNDEIERFEGVINDTVEEYIQKFNDLHDYVEDYFENLDVQEEINNKLDDMVEAGTLQEIITTYIQSNVAWTFDDVDEMQSATNLIAGSYAETFGFYSEGDAGGAKYLIRNPNESETANNITTFDIIGGLIAELIITPSMNVKQFGAKGDGTTDDTNAIQTALNSVENLEFTSDTYKVVYVAFQDNQTIEGNGATLNCLLNTENLIAFGSHLTIKNIEIHSLNNDREWNRLDLRNEEFITFENCIFSGFQQQSIVPPAVGLNCWALYLRECHDIRVINCKFVDNNFQDVLIEFDTYNIVFENCTGSYGGNEGFIVDIEPSQTTGYNRNIKFTNCIFREFLIFEYFNTYNTNKDIVIESSIINKFCYKGGDLSIINSPILSFRSTQASDFLNGDGILKLENSIAISDNLLKDPYIKDVSYNGRNTIWACTYANTAWKTITARVQDAEGDYISLNKDSSSGKTVILKSENISASNGDIFLIKLLNRAYYPSGTTQTTAHHVRIEYYDSSNTLLSTLKLATNRGAIGETQPFSERSCIIVCPANTSYFRLVLRNGDVDSSHKVDYRSVGVYKLTCSSDYRNSIAPLDSGNGKPYLANENPTTYATDKINHFTGERCYYTSPSTYIGAVCTDGANNTYKEFGSLSS